MSYRFVSRSDSTQSEEEPLYRGKIKDEHSLPALAQALEVSQSGFHAHRQKDQRPRQREDQGLTRAIVPIFVASRRTYGCPRITAALRQRRVRCGKNRVARLMREN